MHYTFRYPSNINESDLDVDLECTIDSGPIYDTTFGQSPKGAALTSFSIASITTPEGIDILDPLRPFPPHLIGAIEEEIRRYVAEFEEASILNQFWSNQE